MNPALPTAYLARHGETAWSLSGQHTGLTDLPLTPQGEANAIAMRDRLQGMKFALVLASPLQRARRTCELAGFGGVAVDEPNLVEWNYGDYEGKRTAEILQGRPGWQLFRDGCPGGESPDEVGRRADRVIERARAATGDVLMFSSAHILRVVGARWLGLPPGGGRYLVLGTASLSALGYEHDTTEPVVKFWNEMRQAVPLAK